MRGHPIVVVDANVSVRLRHTAPVYRDGVPLRAADPLRLRRAAPPRELAQATLWRRSRLVRIVLGWIVRRFRGEPRSGQSQGIT